MHVKTLAEASRKLTPISTKNYPAGWSGDVPDDVGQTWISEGKAVLVVDPNVKLTAVETTVLKAAAQQIVQQSQTEELVRLQAELAAMKVADLRELAESHGVALAPKMLKGDIVVAIVADAQAKAAAAQAAVDQASA